MMRICLIVGGNFWTTSKPHAAAAAFLLWRDLRWERGKQHVWADVSLYSVTAPTPACRGCVFCLCILSVGVPVTVLVMTLECAPRRRDPDLMRLCLIGPS